jgi:transposase-like protein
MRRKQVCRTFPEEVKEAAMQRFLTSDLTLSAVGEHFGTGRYNPAAWLKAAISAQRGGERRSGTAGAPGVLP